VRCIIAQTNPTSRSARSEEARGGGGDVAN
jgi:hypothetical protein